MPDIVQIGALLTWLGSVAAFAWWLRSQFSDLKDFFIRALAEHEKGDQARFNELTFRILKIEVQTDPHGHGIPAE